MTTPTPADPNKPIEAQTLNLTKVTTIVGGVLGVGGGVAAFLKEVEAFGEAVQVASLGLAGMLFLGTAAIVAVDILARARVTVATMQAQAVTGQRGSTQRLSDAAAPLGSVISPVNTSFAISAQGSGDDNRVIAVRWDATTGQTYYLAGQAGETPTWHGEDEITDVVFSPPLMGAGSGNN